MTDTDPEETGPQVMEPAEAAEAARKYDIDPEQFAEVLKRRREKEEQESRELFGDGPRLAFPDTDS